MSMNPPAPPPLLARFPAHIGRKLILLVLLPPLLNLCYFLPQWAPLLRIRHHLPLTPIDRAIPFDTTWIVPYLSMYLFLIIPPALSISVDQIRRYLAGMAIMFVVAALCFFFCPVIYDRPPLPAGAHALYRLITNMDQPINCIPSLHAGMTVYAMLFAHRILTQEPPPVRRALLTLGWIWSGLILYGTLATKQHYFLDLPAGALLAWASHYFAWRVPVAPAPVPDELT
jgi:membrane-associated phospholipid phosphatase